MKYVILIGLIVLCVVLIISLVRSIIEFKNKKKAIKTENSQKESNVDVNDSCNRDD